MCRCENCCLDIYELDDVEDYLGGYALCVDCMKQAKSFDCPEVVVFFMDRFELAIEDIKQEGNIYSFKDNKYEFYTKERLRDKVCDYLDSQNAPSNKFEELDVYINNVVSSNKSYNTDMIGMLYNREIDYCELDGEMYYFIKR